MVKDLRKTASMFALFFSIGFICIAAPPPDSSTNSSSSPLPQAAASAPERIQGNEVDWGAISSQSFLFLGIQHAFRLSTEPATRHNLRGPFWKDYAKSVQGLRGWDDGDPAIVNYVGHPIQGAVTNYIWTHNDPQGRTKRFGENGYLRSRFRAMAYSTVYSTLFELGPMGEAGIGNIGIDNKGMGAVDLVITPTVGTAWQVTEDALDRYVIEKLEQKFPNNRVARLLIRGGLNPSRSFANLLRFKTPWHRDTRPGVNVPYNSYN
jgi:hypothetical protein